MTESAVVNLVHGLSLTGGLPLPLLKSQQSSGNEHDVGTSSYTCFCTLKGTLMDWFIYFYISWYESMNIYWQKAYFSLVSILAVAVLFFYAGICLAVQIFSIINPSYRTDLSQIIESLAQILNPSQTSERLHILSFILLTTNIIYFILW